MFISGTSVLSQGEYEIPIPPSPSMNAYFEGFQCMLYISGDVETPASPIAPALESGAIRRKGTTYCMALRSSSCALRTQEDAKQRTRKEMIYLSLISYLFIARKYINIYQHSLLCKIYKIIMRPEILASSLSSVLIVTV